MQQSREDCVTFIQHSGLAGPDYATICDCPFSPSFLPPSACARQSPTATAPVASTAQSPIGFDSNDYPGDAALPALRRTSPSPATGSPTRPANTRTAGQASAMFSCATTSASLSWPTARLDAEIARAKRSGTTPAALGAKDAAAAIAAAQREHFPAHTILFLDQEEGGRLTADQSAYLLAWTEAVARSGYRPGVYASGQPVDDAPGKTITTDPEHPRAGRRAASSRDRVLGLSGRLPTRQRLHPAASASHRQRNARRNRLAVRAVAAPQRDHRSLRQDLRRRRQLLRPRPAGIMLDLSVASSSDPSHGR